MERWKFIIIEKNGVLYDFTDEYMISDCGRVLSFKGSVPKLLKLGYEGEYKVVDLSYNGESIRFYVHRLVATAFIPNPDNKPMVDHINAKPGENNYKNLQWATATENMNNPHFLEVNGRNTRARTGKVKTKKAVRHIPSGKEYPNITKASIDCDISVYYIEKSISKGEGVWEYLNKN